MEGKEGSGEAGGGQGEEDGGRGEDRGGVRRWCGNKTSQGTVRILGFLEIAIREEDS